MGKGELLRSHGPCANACRPGCEHLLQSLERVVERFVGSRTAKSYVASDFPVALVVKRVFGVGDVDFYVTVLKESAIC